MDARSRKACIYCQLRRRVIGLLGLKGLALRGLGLGFYPSVLLAAFGVVAAGMQRMNGLAARATRLAVSAPLWGNAAEEGK